MKTASALLFSMALTLTLTGKAIAGDCLSTPVTYTPIPDVNKFDQRIKHIKDQTENAESKGWISATDASKFKSEYERLAQAEQSTGVNAPKDKVDALEKDITKVHQELHTTIADSKTM